MIDPNGPWRHGARPMKKGGADWTDADYMAYWKSRCVINPVTGCWEWQGFRHAYITGNKSIPGMGYVASSYRGSSVRLHRKVLELKIGRALKGRKDVARHTCDVPYCINPSHLIEGTQADNIQDYVQDGRQRFGKRTHCQNNHEYTPENTRLTPCVKAGKTYTIRVCIKCQLVNHRVKAGWPRDLAESWPPGKTGERPSEMGGLDYLKNKRKRA